MRGGINLDSYMTDTMKQMQDVNNDLKKYKTSNTPSYRTPEMGTNSSWYNGIMNRIGKSYY